MANWVYRTADGGFQVGEYGTPHLINDEPGNFGMVDLDHTPDPLAERWDGADGAREATAEEQAAYLDEIQLHSMDFIVELPQDDLIRLAHQAMWCLAKHAGEGGLDDSSTFLEYLQWVAAGA